MECPGRAARHHSRPGIDWHAWKDALLELGRQFEEPPPILAMSDVHVLALDRAAADLRDRYRLPGYGDGLHSRLTSKRQTALLAIRHDLSRPQTQWVESRDALAAFFDAQSGSVLIKPDFAHQWRRGPAYRLAASRKVFAAASLDTLIAAYDAISCYTPGVLAQR